MQTVDDLRAALERALANGYHRDLLLHTVRRYGAAVHNLCAALLDGQPIRLPDEAASKRLVVLLQALPPIPKQTAGLAESASSKIVERVRALLAKAEATPYPEEAEAFTAKAQELITKHAIDEVTLAGPGAPRRHEVACRHVLLEEPYLKPKYLLLARIARANRCRAISRHDVAMVFGAVDDLESVELLFTSLLTQATRAMLSAGESNGSRSRSFRHGFLVAFAERIGQRLDEANTTAVETATGGTSALPALVERDHAAEAAVDELFPNVRKMTISASDPRGLSAGYAAANRASLGGKSMPQSRAPLPSG